MFVFPVLFLIRITNNFVTSELFPLYVIVFFYECTFSARCCSAILKIAFRNNSCISTFALTIHIASVLLYNFPISKCSTNIILNLTYYVSPTTLLDIHNHF